jgi:arrestin-related trafficking adapter 9
MSASASIKTIESQHLWARGEGGKGGVLEGKRLRKSVSLLGKFTSLGGLKAPGRPKRTISDFHIKLDEPHRQFQPGEFVKGIVSITVEKELKLTHLVVNLKGNVELFNGPTGGGVHTKKEKGSHVFDTLDEETSRLCYDEQVLCADGSLKPGVYQFQFVMLLPGKGLPSSLNVSLQCGPRRPYDLVY